MENNPGLRCSSSGLLAYECKANGVRAKGVNFKLCNLS